MSPEPLAPGLNALQTVEASGKEFLFWADYPFFGTTFPTIDFYRVKLFPFLFVNSVAFYPQIPEICWTLQNIAVDPPRLERLARSF